MSCTLCDAVLLRLDLKTHINNVCPRHVISCQGAIVGCSFRSERADVVQHETTCALATMAPHFREQQARLERHEARIEPLARKVGILEDGLANSRFLVGDAPSLADVALVAYTRLAHEGGFDLAAFPEVRAWIGRVEDALGIAA